MQRYGELKHLVDKLNNEIFGCGFYFFWNYDQPRCMHDQMAKNPMGDVLLLQVAFDPCYAHTYEIYLKRCNAHNLPKDYWIPDHWTKPAFEIQDIRFETVADDSDTNLVAEFTLHLNYRTMTDTVDHYWIKAAGFYFDKVV